MTRRVKLRLAAAAMALAAAAPVPRAAAQQLPAPHREDPNERLEQLRRMLEVAPGDYRIGAEDLLDISVFEAPEMNRTVRVSAAGEISLPLIGAVRAVGLTPKQLEATLQELLRRSYLQDPHVGVFVRELQSRPVSVVGAVKKPGVFQIRGSKTLVEVLAMAEGLAEDAGDTVLVMRGAAHPPREGDAKGGEAGDPPVETTEVDLKRLLESGDASLNVVVNPGDVVKVTRAGIVYVVGEVKKPGGFVLKSNENITVLQALALSEGLLKTSAKGRAQIIRTDQTGGARREIPVDLGKILSGKAVDPPLLPRDILFVPASGTKAALYKSAEAAVSIVSGVIIFRR